MRDRPPLYLLIFVLTAVMLLPNPGALHAQRGGPDVEAVPAGQPLSSTVTGGWATTDDGRLQVVIELSMSPGAVIWAREIEANRGLGEAGATAAAASATRSHLAAVAVQQDSVMAALSAPGVGATEIYRVRKALNAIAVAVRPEALARISQIPGVRSVRPLELEYPTNSTSVPFLGTPEVWENTLGLPFPATGDGISIGIIDTGVDYQHPTFGGTGNLTDYQNNDRTALETGEANVEFPTTKVVGGFDFAGDAYTGSNTPVPDPDPMDCNGHGSHVAGTAAGFGVVDSTDTTFPGPYNTSVPFGTLSVGPGTAPEADLYALRVFGCGGSTGITVLAIEWAMDPNDDADLSDHLDVINMSLGSSNGSVSNVSSVASENAALIGVIVVTSAGNSGDTYFITGSPGVAGRAISVANIADNGISGSVLRVNTPPAIAGDYHALAANFVNNPVTPAPPPPNGETADIVLVNDGTAAAGGGTLNDGCETPFANAAAVAGKIALIDRGLCGFEIKVRNAQLNGAIGAIIANNVVDEPALISMGCTTAGGCSPAITIPSVFVSQATRLVITGQAPPVNGTLVGPNQGGNAADVINLSSSRGPRRASSPIRLKPDVAAPGTSITSAQTGITCTPGGGCIVPDASGFIPAGAPLTISGTSMAAPHIAGIMALLRQLHPDWDVEELKALVMNNALHDVSLGALGSGPHIGIGRSGAGRTDVELTAAQQVTAFNDDEYGLVSASFAHRDIVVTGTEVKTIRVVNHGTTSQTYDLAIELPENANGTPVNDAPGVEFSIDGPATVTVPPGGTATIDVQMDATAADMDHVREASLSPTQAAPAPFTASGNIPRSWLTEEGGHLTFRQSGNLKLRVPLYSAARPASRMTTDDTIVTSGNPTGTTSLNLSGTEVCTGSVDPGPTCSGTFPTTVASLVTPFELQIVSPVDAVNSIPAADLQYGGVSFDNNNTASTADDLILFGFSTWGSWSSQTDVAITVCIDRDENGTYDRILVNSNFGTLAGQFGGTSSALDTFVRGFLTLPGGTGGAAGGSINLLGPNVVDTRLLDNSVLFMAATPAQLNLTLGGTDTTPTAFRYKVVTCPGFNPFCAFPTCAPAPGTFFDEAAGPYFYNYAARGLDFGPFPWLFEDLNGGIIPVAWNTANLATNGSLGGLLLHHHNVEGERAEVFAVTGTAGTGTADLRVSNAVAGTQTVGSNVTFTVTVTNDGPETATGVVVADVLPSGLSYVSDNGAGAYDPASGLWTLPAPLANGGSAALQIVATIDVIDEVCTLAQITAGTPLDGDPSDNQAEVCVSAPREADLAVDISTGSTLVEVGDPITFTIDLDNLLSATPAASQTAYGVSATVSFPSNPGLTMSGTPTAGTFDNGTGVWTIANLVPGGSHQLTVTVNAPSETDLLQAQVTVTSSLNDPDTSNNTDTASVAVGGFYYTVEPCRLLDTRLAMGPYGGPALASNTERDIDAANATCGIPATARAIAITITVANAGGIGHFRLYEDGDALPTTSTLNFLPGQTRANNAIVELATGIFTVYNSSPASNDVVIDVVGYFE